MRLFRLLGVLGVFAPVAAHAFCGFYISGADAKLFNNATMVVMMRDGTRTVLSMQNNYQGPPENFAMVVPVPAVLHKDDVKTLPLEVFDRVDKLAAPRLVEYWEQDPCPPEVHYKEEGRMMPSPAMAPQKSGGMAAKDLGVKIEAQFTVGEYEVVILSAKDSMGLEKWLHQEGYKIPNGAEPYLKPYVAAGSKFFVAKVDVTKVRFENNQAMLSPLRFHYDTDTFALPVRLGLVNSQGTQDLIVHILARGQRYEVANYDNVTIPTNLDVGEAARERFGAFYAALFDRTLEQHPRAVVTEYSWDANTCDPCPSPALYPQELVTLGADVLGPKPPPQLPTFAPPPPGPKNQGAPILRPMPPPRMPVNTYGFVLTRVHARYKSDSLGEDLVFRAAPPIMGGREVPGEGGKLEHGARSGGINNFQGRYAIRHPWGGDMACANPRRGVWGGPPGGMQQPPTPATKLAFAERGLTLAAFIVGDAPDLAVKGTSQPPAKVLPPPRAKVPEMPGAPPRPSGGCMKSREEQFGAGLLLTIAIIGILARRRG